VIVLSRLGYGVQGMGSEDLVLGCWFFPYMWRVGEIVVSS
jgi:hypothetical protein